MLKKAFVVFVLVVFCSGVLGVDLFKCEGGDTYKVKKGDYAWEIWEEKAKEEMPWSKFREVNKGIESISGRDLGTVYPGDVLCVSDGVKGPKWWLFTKRFKCEEDGYKTYEVQEGDTARGIWEEEAKGMSWKEFKALNEKWIGKVKGRSIDIIYENKPLLGVDVFCVEETEARRETKASVGGLAKYVKDRDTMPVSFDVHMKGLGLSLSSNYISGLKSYVLDRYGPYTVYYNDLNSDGKIDSYDSLIVYQNYCDSDCSYTVYVDFGLDGLNPGSFIPKEYTGKSLQESYPDILFVEYDYKAVVSVDKNGKKSTVVPKFSSDTSYDYLDLVDFLSDEFGIKKVVVAEEADADGEAVVLETAESVEVEKAVVDEDGLTVQLVSSFEEFVDAIQPNTKIILPGLANVELFPEDATAEVLNEKYGTDYVRWATTDSDRGFIVSNVENLVIETYGSSEADFDKGKSARLIGGKINFNVLSFDNPKNVVLRGLVIGHLNPLERFSCEGGVVFIEGGSNIKIEKSELYGSGTVGLTLSSVEGFVFDESEIHDCTYALFSMWFVKDAIFRNSKFYKSELADDAFYLSGSEASSNDVTFSDVLVHDVSLLDERDVFFDFNGYESNKNKLYLKNVEFRGNNGSLFYGDDLGLVDVTCEGNNVVNNKEGGFTKADLDNFCGSGGEEKPKLEWVRLWNGDVKFDFTPDVDNLFDTDKEISIERPLRREGAFDLQMDYSGCPGGVKFSFNEEDRRTSLTKYGPSNIKHNVGTIEGVLSLFVACFDSEGRSIASKTVRFTVGEAAEEGKTTDVKEKVVPSVNVDRLLSSTIRDGMVVDIREAAEEICRKCGGEDRPVIIVDFVYGSKEFVEKPYEEQLKFIKEQAEKGFRETYDLDTVGLPGLNVYLLIILNPDSGHGLWRAQWGENVPDKISDAVLKKTESMFKDKQYKEVTLYILDVLKGGIAEGAMKASIDCNLGVVEESVKEVGVAEIDGFVYVPSLGFYVAKEKSHLGKTWNDAHEALNKENLRMLTIKEFLEFLKYTKKEKPDIYKEIIEIREPWRAEWLDADFKPHNDQLYIYYNHRIKDNKLIPRNQELLDKNTLMKDKKISLEFWLNNPTSQGLPRKNTPEGELTYSYPKSDSNSVAWFIADSDGVYLFCGRNPWDSDSSLGVRAVKEVKKEDVVSVEGAVEDSDYVDFKGTKLLKRDYKVLEDIYYNVQLYGVKPGKVPPTRAIITKSAVEKMFYVNEETGSHKDPKIFTNEKGGIRTLDLGELKIAYIPDSIKDLEALETLSLPCNLYIPSLRLSVLYLPSLKRVNLPSSGQFKKSVVVEELSRREVEVRWFLANACD